VQQRLAALSRQPPDVEAHLSSNLRQQVMQAIKARKFQRSFKDAAFPGKRECVGNPFQSQAVATQTGDDIISRPPSQNISATSRKRGNPLLYWNFHVTNPDPRVDVPVSP
jgi:hypothetical protein